MGPTGETETCSGPSGIDAVELNSVFSPDGREFFFTRLIDGPQESGGYPGRTRPMLFRVVYESGAWSAPT
jgi:hypothetical protein